MGLDIYAGTLTRYYSGLWETISQQSSKAPVQTLSEAPDEDTCTPDEVFQTVKEWRTLVGRALKNHLKEPFDWPEGMEAAYFTDQPDWDGVGAVQLLAAFATMQKTDYPKKMPKHWFEHPEFLSVCDDALESPFYHLLQVEIWLPLEFEFVFENECLGEQNRLIGSAPTLLSQLTKLNDTTFKATDAELLAWRQRGPAKDNKFLETAQFGLAVWIHLAKQAVSNRLSMILDY